MKNNKVTSFLDIYKTCKNADGTTDVILPPPANKLERRSLRFFDYQLNFLVSNYNADNISKSLRLALDELIKLKYNIRNLILIQEERR